VTGDPLPNSRTLTRTKSSVVLVKVRPPVREDDQPGIPTPKSTPASGIRFATTGRFVPLASRREEAYTPQHSRLRGRTGFDCRSSLYDGVSWLIGWPR